MKVMGNKVQINQKDSHLNMKMYGGMDMSASTNGKDQM